MMERYRRRMRKRVGQLANSWLVVVGPQRGPGEISRCAKVTLYNNSFGSMLWVVYTLCVPRDNHEAANDPGSYFYCSRPAQKPTSLSLFTTIRRCCPTMCNRAPAFRCNFVSRCRRDLRFAVASSPFRNNFSYEIIDIITTFQNHLGK